MSFDIDDATIGNLAQAARVLKSAVKSRTEPITAVDKVSRVLGIDDATTTDPKDKIAKLRQFGVDAILANVTKIPDVTITEEDVGKFQTLLEESLKGGEPFGVALELAIGQLPIPPGIRSAILLAVGE